MSLKRARTSSPTEQPALMPVDERGSSKLTRVSSSPSSSNISNSYVCSLPPSCSRHPTRLATSKDLEAHYNTYHANVCEVEGCNKVFPDSRLLELHLIECHDPLTAIRQERGEKTFACHLATCTRSFLTPKGRRLHLIEVHGYPKEYFFSITNKGIGGLLERWGEGASLVRGAWKARAPNDDHKDHGEPKQIDGEMTDEDITTPKGQHPKSSSSSLFPRKPTANHTSGPSDPADVDALISSMDSLSLVPSTIRFGRGGKNGGFGFGNSNSKRGGGGGRGNGGRSRAVEKV